MESRRDQGAASRWLLVGAPAPTWLAIAARCLMLVNLIVVGHWVHTFLGGVAFSPKRVFPSEANDTGPCSIGIPILMTLAFGVFMAEAVLTYQAPLLPWLARPDRKRMHYSMHGLAAICMGLGLVAAFQSHNLKVPTPIPNLYSAHSHMGMMTVALFLFQFILGFTSYLYPQFSLSFRQSLGPLHRFLGVSTWVAGLATMAAGFQEKSTLVQMGKSLAGDALYSGVIQLPAAAVVLLILLAHGCPVPSGTREQYNYCRYPP